MMQVLSAGASIGSRRHPCHQTSWRISSENVSEGIFRQHLEYMLGLILFQNRSASNPVFASQYTYLLRKAVMLVNDILPRNHIEFVF